MSNSTQLQHWLSRYANGFHVWKKEEQGGKVTFKRSVGLVEGFFDRDGTQLGGRADIHSVLNVELRTTLGPESLRRRILLAWANLRTQHVLLRSSVHTDPETGLRTFTVRVPGTARAGIEDASNYISFLEDVYPNVEFQPFFQHGLRTGRVVTASESISRLFIFPLKRTSHGTFNLTLLQYVGHMAVDGMTSYNWSSHFLHLLNQDETQLLAQLEVYSKPETTQKLLPPAQEDLCPAIPGNLARQRWFWAIMRILRHVRKPLPTGFVNPIRYKERPTPNLPLPVKYSKVLDYSPENQPPLEGGSISFELPLASSQRLIALARAAGTSVGAGCFAFTALVMMELESHLHPNIPLSERKPFVASFPLNPRPFLNYKGPADSCMLAFSNGVLPWLPVDLDLEGRFKILCRRAHEELKSYQKRLRDPVEGFDPHSPLRLIASAYLTAIERSGFDVQGGYPSSAVMGRATCGVSSVGSVKEFFHKGMYPLDENLKKDFIADFRSVTHGVRPRENEFLVGCAGYGDGILHFGVSYDATAMDGAMVERWKERMKSILEPQGQSKL